MTSSPKPFYKALLPIAVIVAVAIGALFVIKSQLAGRVTAQATAAAPGSTDTSGPGAGIGVGTPIPDLPLTTLQGKTENFSEVFKDSSAKVVLVNFWATWCEACVEEMPSLVKLRDEYKAKGFEVVGINLDENPAAAVPRAEKEFGIRFPIFSDTQNKFTDYFDVHAIPLSVIVGAGRKILYIENGARDWTDPDVRQMMDQWLK